MKKLRLSTQNKMIAGVCGGLAEYFETDPLWIRVVFVALLMGRGSGLLVYLIVWAIMAANSKR